MGVPRSLLPRCSLSTTSSSSAAAAAVVVLHGASGSGCGSAERKVFGWRSRRCRRRPPPRPYHSPPPRTQPASPHAPPPPRQLLLLRLPTPASVGVGGGRPAGPEHNPSSHLQQQRVALTSTCPEPAAPAPHQQQRVPRGRAAPLAPRSACLQGAITWWVRAVGCLPCGTPLGRRGVGVRGVGSVAQVQQRAQGCVCASALATRWPPPSPAPRAPPHSPPSTPHRTPPPVHHRLRGEGARLRADARQGPRDATPTCPPRAPVPRWAPSPCCCWFWWC